MKDSFFTINKPSRGLYKDKGSKFISLAFPVTSEDEINELLYTLKKEYHDARHHCFAWKLGPTGEKYRINDDGEPSGTGGKPVLGQINAKQLTNILVVVIRYFGGILLGTGGLIKAYREAAADALRHAVISEQYVRDTYRVSCNYQNLKLISKIIEEYKGEQSDRDFSEKCSLTVSLRQSYSQKFVDSINRLGETEIKIKKLN